MTDKSEAQIEREKQAIAAMSNAKSTMTTVLARTATLEASLDRSKRSLIMLKDYVGKYACLHSTTSGSGKPPTIQEFIDAEVSNINTILP